GIPGTFPPEYFLIENRQPVGFDAALPGSGLLLWHVDESQTSNDVDTHRLLDLEEADEALTGDHPTDSGDPWHDTATGWGPDTVARSASDLRPSRCPGPDGRHVPAERPAPSPRTIHRRRGARERERRDPDERREGGAHPRDGVPLSRRRRIRRGRMDARRTLDASAPLTARERHGSERGGAEQHASVALRLR